MNFNKQVKRCDVWMGGTCVLRISVKSIDRSIDGNMLMITDTHGMIYETAVQNVILYYGNGDDK